MRRLARFLPLFVLLAGLAAAWAVGLRQELSWPALAAHQAALRAFVTAHPVAAPIAYTLVYVAVTALSIPEAALLSVIGGLLFGTVLAAICVVLGATAGAVLLFLAARSALAAPLRRRAAPLLDRIRPGLERDGFSYLLSLRLLPIVPFWLVNLAPALVGMRLAPFFLATLIGIIPGVLFFVSLGAGLRDVLALGGEPDLSEILAPDILLPRTGLALLALAPVLWRRWRRSHG
ncbi:MAG: TVP38/TMEM64 family protein [Alphaproteobacteria bacterium]|nr:TVP38/TMEM64 family protein [Alphaproteobacteria bacterium]